MKQCIVYSHISGNIHQHADNTGCNILHQFRGDMKSIWANDIQVQHSSSQVCFQHLQSLTVSMMDTD
ncbi:MAG: hypothetical protein ACLUR5_18250 [Eubacterium ventriosum]